MTRRKRKLEEVIPVRVTRRHKAALGRIARKRDTDVSRVVRDMIEDGIRRITPASDLERRRTRMSPVVEVPAVSVALVDQAA